MAEEQKIQSDANDLTAALPPGRSLWSDAWRRLAKDRGAMICLIVIALFATMALGGAVYDLVAARSGGKIPTFQDMSDIPNANKAPTAEKFLWCMGTDWLGRSVLIKTILGAKVSMAVGFMSNIIAVPLGMFLGALAGYFGRKLDDGIVWLYSTLASIPGIILLIAMKYAFKGINVWGLDLTGIHGIYIALGVISWIGTCRLVRAESMKLREMDYVIAARACGRGELAILVRHILPNVMHIGIINFSLGFVGAIGSEVILSYLGIGVDVGVPSWGTMINSARMDLMAGRWWELTAACSAMFVLILALNIFGDRLRDALDPRLKNT